MTMTLRLASCVLLLTTAAANAENFTVSNTFQDPKMTRGKELPSVELNAEVFADQSAEIGDGVELESYIGFYNIDFSEDMTKLTMTVSDTARPSHNPMPEERYDRYYYTFDGTAPYGATIDAVASSEGLGDYSAVDVVDDKLVVEFGEGADITPGNTLVINLQ